MFWRHLTVVSTANCFLKGGQGHQQSKARAHLDPLSCTDTNVRYLFRHLSHGTFCRLFFFCCWASTPLSKSTANSFGENPSPLVQIQEPAAWPAPQKPEGPFPPFRAQAEMNCQLLSHPCHSAWPSSTLSVSANFQTWFFSLSGESELPNFFP